MSTARRRTRRLAAVLITTTLATMTAIATMVGLGPVAEAARVTPGNFTGYGFDQCEAPTQQTMNHWLTTSPYWSVGIYVSGDARGCPDQPNLTRSWVTTQLQNGWRLLPITVGPQASCNDRYRARDRITPNPADGYAAARLQGRQEATTTVAAARALGIGARSTLWYDLEAFKIGRPKCRDSALSFLSGWTRRLHQVGYVSGVYSSASSGITMLDDQLAAKRGGYALPDRVWIADWNGAPDLSSTYVRPTSWMPHRRVHQYLGGHSETHGGITMTVDSNFLSLGHGSVAPQGHLACGVGISLPRYPRLRLGSTGPSVKALHCLLKRAGTYAGRLNGRVHHRTLRAVRQYQRRHHLQVRGVVTSRMWTMLLSGGASTPILKFGSASDAVRRLQRSVNAAVDAGLHVSGVFDGATMRAVRLYQRTVQIAPNGVVAAPSWSLLQRGIVAVNPDVAAPRSMTPAP